MEKMDDERAGAVCKLDAILYINLAHRADRNEHVLAEIRKINPSLDRAYRVDAVHVPECGALGASMSHVKALEVVCAHPEWARCAILEDDFTLGPNALGNLDAVLSCEHFDVLLLGLGSEVVEDTGDPRVRRVLSSQTASGYIVHRDYAGVLLANFRAGLELLRSGASPQEACVDMYWKRLMPEGRWYAARERVGYQYANYSDIESGFRDYGC